MQATEKHDEELAACNRELTGLQALNSALNKDLKVAEEECRQQEADATSLREQLAGSTETHVGCPPFHYVLIFHFLSFVSCAPSKCVVQSTLQNAPA